jgi:hypothetical protein
MTPLPLYSTTPRWLQTSSTPRDLRQAPLSTPDGFLPPSRIFDDATAPVALRLLPAYSSQSQIFYRPLPQDSSNAAFSVIIYSHLAGEDICCGDNSLTLFLQQCACGCSLFTCGSGTTSQYFHQEINATMILKIKIFLTGGWQI